MSDEPKPLLLGHLRSNMAMTPGELDDLRERLQYFADRHGYQLGTVFIERVGRSPYAFMRLVEAAWRNEAVAVVAPAVSPLAAGWA